MTGPMPVLTLWQPWASLVALEAKTIETRSWSTKYRGPLAIAAAARKPSDRGSEINVGGYHLRGFGRSSFVLEGPGLPEYRSTPRFAGYVLPLGKIVATCTLVDVVPIVDDPRARNCVDVRVGHPAAGMSLRLDTRVDDVYPYSYEETIVDVADQRTFGDFVPGRFAWLLDDVVALDEPVPFKGGQGLSRKWSP